MLRNLGYRESKKRIEAAAEIEKYLTRADLFLAQKAYDEALRELKKVQSYDPDNAEAKKRIDDISEIRKKHDNKVASLVSQYEDAKKAADYKAAISVCEKLADLDSLNQKKWTAETEKLRAEEENYQRELRRFEELKRKAMDADFREEWVDFVHFAEEALQIKEDADLSSRIEKAKSKLKEKEKKEQYQNTINQVNKMLLDEENEEAESILNQLQKDYPEHKEEIKTLRKRLFSQDFKGARKEPKKPSRPIGFRTEEKKVDADDFFGTDTKQPKSPQRTEQAPKKENPVKTSSRPKPNSTGIDFFDMDVHPKKGDTKRTNPHSDIDNNFNF